MKMKLNFWFLAIGVVALSACSSDNDLYDPAKAAAKKEAQYEAAFVKKYGTIAADQDWGFGAVEATTRVSNANAASGNDETVNMPTDISQEEYENVLSVFNKKINAAESININWTDFWVQHVYKGTTEQDTWKLQNGQVQKVVGSNHMDKLVVGKPDGSEEHVNNFNAANGSKMLMQDSGTDRFGYLNSLDSKNHYNYVVLEINGSYYVGFDFESFFSDEQQGSGYLYGDKNVDADGYYNDWIVKISPANYTNASRIIAEDLGESDDFDFNDVVFDVATDGSATIVTLQAAGGTLPLYIQVGSDQREVHELFGVPTTTMVNTGGLSKAPVMYRVSGTGAVEILVQGQTAGTYKLKGDIGKAPQKIAVPTTYEWTEERQSIESKYPKFSDWVGDTTINWIE